MLYVLQELKTEKSTAYSDTAEQILKILYPRYTFSQQENNRKSCAKIRAFSAGERTVFLPEQGQMYVCSQASSTQDVAWDLFLEGAFPVWSSVLACEQFSGRGQYNKVWESMQGNLFVSIRIPKDALSDVLYFPMLCGSILTHFLHTLGYDTAIKWMNDIILEEGKVAGVLLEENQGIRILGIGCNVAKAPRLSVLPCTLKKAIALNDVQLLSYSLGEFFEKFLFFFYEHYKNLLELSWEEHKLYMTQYLVGYKKQVMLHTETTKHTGIFADITQYCAVALENNSGTLWYPYDTIQSISVS